MIKPLHKRAGVFFLSLDIAQDQCVLLLVQRISRRAYGFFQRAQRLNFSRTLQHVALNIFGLLHEIRVRVLIRL